jgi:penicillin amidase
MKVFKFLVSSTITVGLILVLNSGLTVGGNSLPPIGKFLDPFHGFWQNAETSVPDLPAELEFPGLRSEVEIIFDTLMIPHIFAENDEDLYFAQGYIHAYHRLWQMEFQIYFAEGRLSELIGEATLSMDRNTRRKGMKLGAERFLEKSVSDPEIKAYLDSYSNVGIIHQGSSPPCHRNSRRCK